MIITVWWLGRDLFVFVFVFIRMTWKVQFLSSSPTNDKKITERWKENASFYRLSSDLSTENGILTHNKIWRRRGEGKKRTCRGLRLRLRLHIESHSLRKLFVFFLQIKPDFSHGHCRRLAVSFRLSLTQWWMNDEWWIMDP